MLKSYADTPEGIAKIHRTVNSEDVIEYASHVPPREVQFHEEDDIEYREGKLVKSNGTVHLSLDRSAPLSHRDGGDQLFADVFTTRGSFNMELRMCRVIQRSSRRRRATQQTIEGSQSLEESLLATINESGFLLLNILLN